MGDCMKMASSDRKTDYLKGCPPSSREMFDFLRKAVKEKL